MMPKIDAENLDLAGWPLPDEYLIEIGRLALVWSRLETLLRNSVANLAGLENLADPRLFAVFNFSDFDRNVELLEILCAQQASGAPNLQRHPELVAQLRTAKKSRSLYIDGGLTPNPGDGEIEMDIPSATDPHRTVARKVSVVDIRRAMMAIDETQHTLYNLIAALERPDRLIRD